MSDTAIVYPNPTAYGLIKINLGKFNISNIQEKRIQLLVYDAGGRLCINKVLVDNITAINLNRLSKGVYFIKIISLDSSINYCTKIVK
jgi:signal recognition particle GTPase